MAADAGPVTTASHDGSGQGRRSWVTSVGILVTGGVVIAGMSLAGRGSTSPQPTTTQAPVQAAPTSAAAAAPPTTTAPAPPTTTTAPRTTTAIDVDGDGRPDTVTTKFVSKRTAQLVVHLATGKTLTSKAFPLYEQAAAGKVFAADINGDHHSELFVSDPGADGIGYDLFSYVRSSLVAVPAAKGTALYVGGGMYYDSTFGCSHGRLLQVKEQPDVKNTANLPADPPFLVTTTTYALSGGLLKATDVRTVGVPDRAAAMARLAASGNGCGTRP
ncbi:MAG: hypothetical protein QOI76_1251 [Frankiales bacterium]|nr:hypothetical protein [Frankiales bacterium]